MNQGQAPTAGTCSAPLFNSPTAEQHLQLLLTPLSSFMSPFINDSREKLMLWYKLCNWKEKREIMQLTLPKPVRIAGDAPHPC